jgi:hypothetical protein
MESRAQSAVIPAEGADAGAGQRPRLQAGCNEGSPAPAPDQRERAEAIPADLRQRLKAMGIRDRPISARSPWENGVAERVIGSIRRDCLDHGVLQRRKKKRIAIMS